MIASLKIDFFCLPVPHHRLVSAVRGHAKSNSRFQIGCFETQSCEIGNIHGGNRKIKRGITKKGQIVEQNLKSFSPSFISLWIDEKKKDWVQLFATQWKFNVIYFQNFEKNLGIKNSIIGYFQSENNQKTTHLITIIYHISF